MSDQRFKDQVAIITGGAAGLGRAVATRLAAEGARVAIFDLDDAGARRVAEALKGRAYRVDVASEPDVSAAVAAVERDLGPIGIMVNCAGLFGPTNTNLVDYPLDRFDFTLAVNLRGSFLMTKAVLPSMLRQRYGRVLLLSSIAGKEGNAGMVGYSAAKSGVIGLVKGVAKECATTGVTVNGLAPAAIMTDLWRDVPAEQIDLLTAKIPMKRTGTVDEAASLIAWIVSPECSFTTGFIFDLSGGRATY